MTIDREQFKALATQFRDLQDSNKDNVAKFLEKVEGQGIDPAGLRRFVAWKRKDETKRAQQEAVDQQCLYLAGERDTPAELPIGCELAQAINLFRRNMTVQQVAAELRVSNGKAGKLRQLAQMFDVSIHAKVDGRRKPKVQVITPPEAATLPTHDTPGHDAKGNPLQGDADGVIVEDAAPHLSVAEGVNLQPGPESGEGTGTNSTEGEDDVATGQSESAHASDRVGVPVLARSESGGGGECSGEGCGLRAEEHETAEIESQEAPIASGPQDLSTAEPEVAVAAPPATDPEEDDLAFPDFLDVRKRRAEQVPA